MRIVTRPSELQFPSGKIVSDATPSPQSGFAQELQKSVAQMDDIQHQADQAMQEGSLKGAGRIDETMIKLEEAEISLRLLTKVRNKALDAYQEVMRMQF